MKNKIKELKKLYKEALVNYDSGKYNNNKMYVRIADNGYFVKDITTIKNGIETRVIQTTVDVYKAKKYTLDEVIDIYFETTENEYYYISEMFKGFGEFKLSTNYGESQNIFKEYLELEKE